MRNIIAVGLLFIFAEAISAGTSLSIGAGVNYSTISGSDSLVTKSSLRSIPKTGPILKMLNYKIGLQQNFSKHISLVTGVSLEMRGEKNVSIKKLTETITQEITENINILNLQVPVMAQVSIPFRIFCLDIFAGPELGIFLSGEKDNMLIVHVPAVDATLARNDTTKTKSDFAKDMNMLEFGIGLGIGFEIKTGSFGSVFLSPGVYIGLTDILQKDIRQKNPRPEADANLYGKNSSISFTIGYKFNVKPKKVAIENDIDKENVKIVPDSNKTNEYPSNIDQYNNFNTPDSNNSSSGNESSDSESSDSDSESYSTP